MLISWLRIRGLDTVDCISLHILHNAMFSSNVIHEFQLIHHSNVTY